MNTKTLFWLIAVLSLLSVSCDKNSPAGHNSGNNGEKPDEPLAELPELEETDDVCTKMDDLNFMAYCYDNFDVNNDGKVSMTEANAVTTIECNNATSFAGMEYFPNLKSFASSSVGKPDFRYNKNLETIDCSDSDIESVDLRYNDKLTSIKFINCKLLTDVAFPNKLTSIGDSAFKGCSSLASITIPESVTSIESSAFSGCSSLTSINLPDNLTSIGDSAFKGCSSLASITIPEGVTSIGVSAFDGCSSLSSITIPEGVTSIGSSAFSGCSSLASINLPDKLTSVGGFSGCSSLTSINLPDNLTSIGDSAFRGCSSLASITIPERVTSIESYAFWVCESLTSVDASLCRNLESIDHGAFGNCPIKEFLLGTSNPPSLSDTYDYIFNGMPDDAVLKVPAQSEEAYKNSDWADYFGTIEAL